MESRHVSRVATSKRHRSILGDQSRPRQSLPHEYTPETPVLKFRVSTKSGEE